MQRHKPNTQEERRGAINISLIPLMIRLQSRFVYRF